MPSSGWSSTCFQAIPLPWSPSREPAHDLRLHAIADAVREPSERRRAWLNPEGASKAELSVRTLTSLYNAR